MQMSRLLTHTAKLVAIFIFSSAIAAAQQKASEFFGAFSEIRQLDRHDGSCTVRVTNTSSKQITGIIISYESAYSDGSRRTGERTIDFLPRMISRQAMGLDSGGLAPGSSY